MEVVRIVDPWMEGEYRWDVDRVEARAHNAYTDTHAHVHIHDSIVD